MKVKESQISLALLATLAGLISAGLVTLFRLAYDCLLYTSPSPRDATLSRMPSSA